MEVNWDHLLKDCTNDEIQTARRASGVDRATEAIVGGGGGGLRRDQILFDLDHTDEVIKFLNAVQRTDNQIKYREGL